MKNNLYNNDLIQEFIDNIIHHLKKIERNTTSNTRLITTASHYQQDISKYYKQRQGEFKELFTEEQKIKNLYNNIDFINIIENTICHKIKKLEKETCNQFSINYYNDYKFITPHKDSHDIVVIILLEHSNIFDDSLKIIIDNEEETLNKLKDLKKEEIINSPRNIDKLMNSIKNNIRTIELKLYEPVILEGGAKYHFTVPNKNRRVTLVLNYNLDYADNLLD
jgi:hypothetical protein